MNPYLLLTQLWSSVVRLGTTVGTAVIKLGFNTSLTLAFTFCAFLGRKFAFGNPVQAFEKTDMTATNASAAN